MGKYGAVPPQFGTSFTDVVLRELPASSPCKTGRQILDSLERDYPAKPKKARAA